MSKSEDGLNAEMFLDHLGCDCLFETRDEDSSGELFLFFILFIHKGGIHQTAGVLFGREGSVGERS